MSLCRLVVSAARPAARLAFPPLRPSARALTSAASLPCPAFSRGHSLDTLRAASSRSSASLFSTLPLRFSQSKDHAPSADASAAPAPLGPSPADAEKQQQPEQPEQPRLQIVFTCKVCAARSGHFMTKHAYTKGVVLVRCPGCKNIHLIADNLGWFQNGPVNIETLMKQKGEEVKRLTSHQLFEFAGTGTGTGTSGDGSSRQ